MSIGSLFTGNHLLQETGWLPYMEVSELCFKRVKCKLPKILKLSSGTYNTSVTPYPWKQIRRPAHTQEMGTEDSSSTWEELNRICDHFKPIPCQYPHSCVQMAEVLRYSSASSETKGTPNRKSPASDPWRVGTHVLKSLSSPAIKINGVYSVQSLTDIFIEGEEDISL